MTNDTNPNEAARNQTAAVIGLTGSFGGAVARELLRRGWKIRALVRDIDKARELFGDEANVELVEGDALEVDDIRRATRGASVLVDSFNVSYEKWDPATLTSARLVAKVAAEQKLLVVFPGNVYGLGPDFSRPLAEDAPRQTPSKKGRIRNRIETLFAAAADRGARFVILRCGDFFGPQMPQDSSWLSHMLKDALDGGAILYPGDMNTPHQWAYLPDAAVAAVDLVERADGFEPFEIFHFGGHYVRPGDFVDAVRAALGDPQRKVKKFGWWMVWLAQPFSAMLRELYEMRYLWDEPLQLDDTKLRATLGEVTQTPLDEAVRLTVAGMGGSQLDRPAPVVPQNEQVEPSLP